MSGSGPFFPILKGVWQALQPMTVTRYLPPPTRSAEAVAGGADAGCAAVAAPGTTSGCDAAGASGLRQALTATTKAAVARIAETRFRRMSRTPCLESLEANPG